jgi:hypothetical protein
MAGKIQDAPEEYFSAVEYVDVTFAVMGVTGAGKSSFVRDCSGYEVKVGESLTSCKFVWHEVVKI